MTLLTKALVGCIGILAAACIYLGFEADHQRHEAMVANSKLFDLRATELGTIPATIVPQINVNKLTPKNQKVVTGLKTVDHGVKATLEIDQTARFDSVTPAPAETGQSSWDDPHHRFHLDLNTLEFRRKQEFALQSVVVQSSSGQTTLTTDLVENDPVTHLPITDEPQPVIHSAYRVVKQDGTVPTVSVFHPRIVAAVGYLGQVGLGVEVLNLERFGGIWKHGNVSVLGLYNLNKKTVEGSACLGFRPFNWNLSLGPAYFFPTNALGAAATLELTR